MEKRSTVLLFFSIIILNSNFAFGQSKNIDCDSVWSNFNMKAEPTELILLYEKAPRLIGGCEQLKRKVIDDNFTGNVYLQFVVDTMGETRCIRILETDNKGLNDQAIKLITEMKFTPAEQRGDPIVSTMILTITFEKEKIKENKRKR